MTATQIRSSLRWLVIATVMIVPLVFWRSVADAFDLVKGTILALFGLAILLTLGMLAALERRHIAAKPTLIIAGVFSAAAIISTVTSMDPLQSVIGQYQRYTGLVTLLASVLVLISISASFDQKRLIGLGQVLVITASGVALYGFLQQAGADPFQWTSESFGKFVFGTMGNPNTGTAFVSVVSPITAWAMLRKAHPSAVRIVAGGLFGVAMGIMPAFQSFQGYVAFGFAVVYLAVNAWWNGRTLGQWLMVVFTAAALVIAILQEGLSWLAGLIVIYAAVFAALAAFADQIAAIRLPESLVKFRSAMLGALGAVVLLGAALFGRRLYDFVEREFAGSLVERGDFYRAGWAIFKDYPIFGSGLETYGHLFTNYRPIGHAVNLEGSRTSSVHSMHLGMFSNGGLILGLAYLALIAVVIWAVVRGLRRDRQMGSGLLLAAGCAYLGFQFQSSVSVEHVGLHLLHFTLAGLILAMVFPVLETTTVVNRGGKRKYGKNTRATVMPAPVLIGSLLVWLLISGFVTLRPIRGATASFEGVRAATQLNDVPAGIAHLDRGLKAAPWEGLWWVQRAEMRAFNEDLAGAAADAAEAARKLRYKPGSAVSLARIVTRHAEALINAGERADGLTVLEESLDIARRGAVNDPFAPQVQTNTANFFSGVAGVYAQLGEEQRARDLIAEALTYDASNAAAAELLNSLDNPPADEDAADGEE
jgi:O-antigen ligase